jgi:putative Holliday junction resolvase
MTHHPSPITHHPKTGTVLAFDFGEKRIGVAVGDLSVGIPHPLTTIDAEENRTRFAAIAALIDEWRPVRLVVGLPAHADGTEHETGRLARRFAHRLEGRFGLTVDLVDERFTSMEAETKLREQGPSGGKQKVSIDALAAQEILQTYFSIVRGTIGTNPG